MKKIYLLTCLVLFSLAGFCQSFKGPSTAETGTSITLTAVDEATPMYGSSNYEFTGVNSTLYNGTEATISYPGGTFHYNYVDATTLSVISVHNVTHTATTIKLNVINTFNQPVTATFYIHANYTKGIDTYSDVKIPYVVTIQPSSTIIGGQNPPTTDDGVVKGNGAFIQDINTGKIYFRFEGKLRYIPTQATLHGLWKYDDSMLWKYTTAQLSKQPVGDPFTADNGFICDKNNANRVYLREGNYIRWIPTSQIFNAYHFNWNILKDVYGISGYTVGPDIAF